MVKTIVSLCAVFCSIWVAIFEPSPRYANTFATSKPFLAAPSSVICASKSSSEISPLRYALSSCCTSKSRVAIDRFPPCLGKYFFAPSHSSAMPTKSSLQESHQDEGQATAPLSRSLNVIKPRRVGADDLLHVYFRNTPKRLRDQVLGVRPGGVGVRIV